ncbi:helix-hairpin-helix domain-containing protein [Flavihumibacter profundi]|jgi:hypothetical protein|uniref:hypothetical protein n=1 Tax=Flavihumibacter profundi TaxID=2716883 RepID=UPI001CC34CB6|nr:hypothetical protein [Flavihumibacter profundi]MBZ5857120.1 hypothetical protein [Flavihumibacter profundi]
MNRIIYISLLLILHFSGLAQEPSEQVAGMLEAATEANDQEPDNDQLQQVLVNYLRRPISVNHVTEEQLKELSFLSPMQISSFLQYRNLFGILRNRYELQAIPYWDIGTIRKILPYLSFREDTGGDKEYRTLVAKGQHQLLMRSSNILEKAKGFIADSAKQAAYIGSSARLFYRYTYQYKQQLWWGIAGDKDAGEKPGDFSSFHVFMRRPGLLKTIALGDYVLNIGQGLVQWQGLAFGKTSEAMNVYHQGNLLQPYRSGGEWNFHRGVALQFQSGHWEATFFGSARKLTANLVEGADGTKGFSSISQSGYHRTAGELADRNSITQYAYGTVLQYTTNHFRLGGSVIKYQFSLPFMPVDRPYNKYAIRGAQWFNSGVHYSYVFRNVFLFGEGAACATGYAFLQGMVLSIHHKSDLSLVYRHVQPGYQALYAHSFLENSEVTNETGFYAGFRLTPLPGWQLQAYADYFRFPWLRFRATAPVFGKEYFMQLTWVRRKKWETYLRYRTSGKPENNDDPIPVPLNIQHANLRWHAERIINPLLIVAARTDFTWYSSVAGRETGWSAFLDGRYQVRKLSLALAARLQYFHTGGYNSRIYAYERDLLYSFSIPSFYDKGLRYYLQVQGKPGRIGNRRHWQLQWWLRWSQTSYGKGHTIGSGNDEISGSHKSEWKCQLMITG